MHPHQELIDYIEDGNFTEAGIERYLLTQVLSQEQKDFLRNNDLSFSIIVNGQYECVGDIEQRVADWMRSVNATLGYQLFITV